MLEKFREWRYERWRKKFAKKHPNSKVEDFIDWSEMKCVSKTGEE